MSLLGSITAGLQVASGIAGLFGGKKKSPAARQMAAANAEQSALNKRILEQALAFDPIAEQTKAAQYATKDASRLLDIANRTTMARGMANGYAPGDTNFAIQLQQNADGILRPLAQQIYEGRANAAQQKLQMSMNAARMLGPSALNAEVQGIAELNSKASQQSLSGSIDMLSNGVDSLMNKPKGKAPAKEQAAGYSGHSLPSALSLSGPNLGELSSLKDAYRKKLKV